MTHTLEFTLRGDTEMVLRRSFSAPRDLVFRCFTDPDLLVRWLGCGFGETALCVVDPTIGGVWRHQMDMGERGLFDSFGQTLEFEPPRRLVRSYVYNVPVIREAICRETATFEDHDGVTTLEVVIAHLCRENRDGHAASGIEFGAGMSYDALERLLGELAQA